MGKRWLNQMEVEGTRERTIMGIQDFCFKNTEMRYKPPYGYNSKYASSKDDKDKGILEINPTEADIVRKQVWVECRPRGLTNSQIVDQLIDNRPPYTYWFKNG